MTVIIHARGELIFSAAWEPESLELRTLLLDDERLRLVNRLLGLAGACVDKVALDQSRKEGGV